MGSEVQGEVAQGGNTQPHGHGLGERHLLLQQDQDLSSMNKEEFEEYLLRTFGCNSSSEWIREW